jgi:hypothetical protein
MTLAGLNGISTLYGAFFSQSRIVSMSASKFAVRLLLLLTLDSELVAVSDGALQEDSNGVGQLLKSWVIERLKIVVVIGLISDGEILV